MNPKNRLNVRVCTLSFFTSSLCFGFKFFFWIFAFFPFGTPPNRSRKKLPVFPRPPFSALFDVLLLSFFSVPPPSWLLFLGPGRKHGFFNFAPIPLHKCLSDSPAVRPCLRLVPPILLSEVYLTARLTFPVFSTRRFFFLFPWLFACIATPKALARFFLKPSPLSLPLRCYPFSLPPLFESLRKLSTRFAIGLLPRFFSPPPPSVPFSRVFCAFRFPPRQEVLQ